MSDSPLGNRRQHVITAPAHLAGATVVAVNGALLTDRPHPTQPGNIIVTPDYVETRLMSPDELRRFRAELGEAPEVEDVRRALASLFGATEVSP